MRLGELKNLIHEIVDEELEEMSGTGAVAGFYTPFSFTGDKKANKEKRRKVATQSGYTLAPRSGEKKDNTIFEITHAEAMVVNQVAKKLGAKFGWSADSPGVWLMSGDKRVGKQIIDALKKANMTIGNPRKVGTPLFIPVLSTSKGKYENVNEWSESIKLTELVPMYIAEVNVEGWDIQDISFVTKGPDPTYYQRYILRKGNKIIKVEEFFGDWYISTDTRSRGRGPYNRKQADQMLRQARAPITNQIESFKRSKHESTSEAYLRSKDNMIFEVLGKEAAAVLKAMKEDPHHPLNFSKRHGKKIFVKTAMDNWDISKDEALEMYNLLKEAGDPYYAWRNDTEMTPKMKIGNAISEINKTLKEVERVVKRCRRLKKEMGMNANDYWKRTNNSLLKIESRVHKLAQAVREMRV